MKCVFKAGLPVSREFYSAVRRLSCTLIPLVACSAALLPGQCRPDLTGEWEITTSQPNYSGTLHLTVAGTLLTGYLHTPMGSAAITSGRCSDVSVTFRYGSNWYTASPIGADRNAIKEGLFGSTTGGANGSWKAKRRNGPPEIGAITNSASGGQGQVAPGQLISIYTTGATTNPIGPESGVGLRLENGRVSNTIGGVTVEFLPIGVLAPLTYVSNRQVNAIVPFEVAGLSQVQVRVNFNGRSSEPFPVSVAQTAPGIFTMNGSGTGPGAILNHDGSVNSVARPERRGGVIVLYLTGAGQTAPPGISGRVPADSEPYTTRPLAPATVHINGQPARILFYGEAAGLVSGAVQMNVEVP